jgi:hypothetical protein
MMNRDRSTVNFIKSELELSIAFLRTARRERSEGSVAAAERAEEVAKEAYDNAERFLPRVKSRIPVRDGHQIAESKAILLQLIGNH